MGILRLLRLPAVFTAIADVLAGFFIIKLSGLGVERVGALPQLLVASAFLYMAGMVWNDIFDYDSDLIERPTRALPSGAVSMTTAFMLAIVLTLSGLMLSMTAGMTSFLTASALVFCIFLYNALSKKIEILGALNMGCCRGLNLFLGMSAHSYLFLMSGDAFVFLPPILLGIYITIITVLSRMEGDEQEAAQLDSNNTLSAELSTEMDSEIHIPQEPPLDRYEGKRLSEIRRKRELELVLKQNVVDDDLPEEGEFEEAVDPLAIGLGLTALAATFLATLWILPFSYISLAGLGLLAILLAIKAVPCFKTEDKVQVKKLVGVGVGGVCLFDAALVAASGDYGMQTLIVSGVIAGLLIPVLILRRYINIS